MANMRDHTGCIVLAEAGREKGSLFCVARQEGEFLFLVDGHHRRMAQPKRKKLRHVSVLTGEEQVGSTPVLQQLREGTTPSNRDLRRVLAAFRAQSRRV